MRIFMTHFRCRLFQHDVEELLYYRVADDSCAVEGGGAKQLFGDILFDLVAIVEGVEEDVGIEGEFIVHSSHLE